MKGSQPNIMTIIGRGHSGTRILSHMLYASGVFMGKFLNDSGDTLPPKPMYEAGHILADRVRWNGGVTWDFGPLRTTPVDPGFESLVRDYLRLVLESDKRDRGWKLPETTLAYPWIVRMFPEVKYVYIVRDPRDALLKPHRTDDLRECNVPGPETDDALERRVASWKYHREIVKATPPPENFLLVRFEDLVLDHEATAQGLEDFLGIPLVRVIPDETRVGQWRSNPCVVPYLRPLGRDMEEMGYE